MIVSFNSPVINSVFDGSTISFYDDKATEFFNLKTDNETANFLKNYQRYVFNNNITYEISWDKGTAPFTVIFAKDMDFNCIFLQKSVDTNNLSITANDYFIEGTYYYKIVDSKNKSSKIDSFKTDSKIQILNLENIYNVRDLGGLKTKDNRTIKYKKLFRGGKLEDASQKDIEVFNCLGIVTDLDLRGTLSSEESLKKNGPSLIGLEKYYLTKINTYDDIITYHDYMASRYKETFDVLCDESNYPIYFHCTWGADRTGMIAFLVEAYLGVSLDDIYKDFEITSFSEKAGARWRSNIIGEEGNYTFDDSGVQRSDVRFGLTIQKILANYSNGTNDLQLAVKNYLLSIGVTQEQMDNLVKILIE